MTAWLVVLVAGFGSFLFRVSMLVAAGRFATPAWLERASGFAVPTVFAALAAAALVEPAGSGRDAIAPLAAVAAGALAAHRTGSPRAAVMVGMPVLWVLAAVVPS